MTKALHKNTRTDMRVKVMRRKRRDSRDMSTWIGGSHQKLRGGTEQVLLQSLQKEHPC